MNVSEPFQWTYVFSKGHVTVRNLFIYLLFSWLLLGTVKARRTSSRYTQGCPTLAERVKPSPYCWTLSSCWIEFLVALLYLWEFVRHPLPRHSAAVKSAAVFWDSWTWDLRIDWHFSKWPFFIILTGELKFVDPAWKLPNCTLEPQAMIRTYSNSHTQKEWASVQ